MKTLSKRQYDKLPQLDKIPYVEQPQWYNESLSKWVDCDLENTYPYCIGTGKFTRIGYKLSR